MPRLGRIFSIVLWDDLGCGDLRCHGNRGMQTLHIDKFAAEGSGRAVCQNIRIRPTRIAVSPG